MIVSESTRSALSSSSGFWGKMITVLKLNGPTEARSSTFIGSRSTWDTERPSRSSSRAAIWAITASDGARSITCTSEPSST